MAALLPYFHISARTSRNRYKTYEFSSPRNGQREVIPLSPHHRLLVNPTYFFVGLYQEKSTSVKGKTGTKNIKVVCLLTHHFFFFLDSRAFSRWVYGVERQSQRENTKNVVKDFLKCEGNLSPLIFTMPPTRRERRCSYA